MILKVHRAGGKKILALCDSDILGKRFEDGKLQLDLSSGFYRGEKATKDELEREAKSAYIINAAGKRSVGLLLELGFIQRKDVKEISGIPYTMLVFD